MFKTVFSKFSLFKIYISVTKGILLKIIWVIYYIQKLKKKKMKADRIWKIFPINMLFLMGVMCLETPLPVHLIWLNIYYMMNYKDSCSRFIIPMENNYLIFSKATAVSKDSKI